MEKNEKDLRIVCFSDPHNRYQHLYVPKGDVLICCGDIIDKTSHITHLQQLKNFNKFMKKMNHRFKIVISGNHDEIIEKLGSQKTSEILSECIYLENNSAVIEGVRFFGSPISLTGKSQNRAFQKNRNSNELNEYLDLIPNDIDVLITHGMPFGHCDGNHGCKNLLEKVMKVKPRYHIFGHHHTSYGSSHIEHSNEKSTTFINSSMLHVFYTPFNEAVMILDSLHAKIETLSEKSKLLMKYFIKNFQDLFNVKKVKAITRIFTSIKEDLTPKSKSPRELRNSPRTKTMFANRHSSVDIPLDNIIDFMISRGIVKLKKGKLSSFVICEGIGATVLGESIRQLRAFDSVNCDQPFRDQQLFYTLREEVEFLPKLLQIYHTQKLSEIKSKNKFQIDNF
eukprot:gene12238-5824_t